MERGRHQEPEIFRNVKYELMSVCIASCVLVVLMNLYIAISLVFPYANRCIVYCA